jgi:hypothetical protein
MKKLTARDKADLKLEAAVWNHGRKKAKLTAIIKETSIADTGTSE